MQKTRVDTDDMLRFVDFQNLKVPSKPNWYLSLPKGIAYEVKGANIGPKFDVSVSLLTKALKRLLGDEPRIKMLAISNTEMRYELIAKTAILRFPDRVSIEIVRLGENHSGLALFSRSKYGYSDFSANRKRVQDWLRRIEAIVQPPKS